MRSSRRASLSSNRRSVAVAPKRKTKSEAETLRFQCPHTGREVDSGIAAQCDARLIGIRLRCPICEHFHFWRVADRNLGAVVSADNPSNDARPNYGQKAHRVLESQNADTIELLEQLLDEFNHRLQNNLRVLYFLLKVAWHKTDNAETREVLSDTSRRIGAMGSAQKVYYSAGISTDVSGQGILEAVCSNAKASFSKTVSIKYRASAGLLPKETALPLALILNELLTNSAKYGAGDRETVISVELRQCSEEIELCVQDRGPGFSFDPAKSKTSGLGLVTMLARRLRGAFTVERRSGARCVLRFPNQ